MSDWISVEDRLPPDDKLVLGFLSGALDCFSVCRRFERPDGNLWTWHSITTHEALDGYCRIPTHWMPLPEPPTVTDRQTEGK